MTGATGRQRVSNSCFDSFLLAVPSRDLIEKFQLVVSVMFKEVFNLSTRNLNLKAQRDLLLPKLVSGSVQVR